MSRETRVKIIFALMIISLQSVLTVLLTGQVLGNKTDEDPLQNNLASQSLAPQPASVAEQNGFVALPFITKSKSTVSLCRYGVVAKGQEQVDKVGDFGVGFYVHFGGFLFPATNGANIVGIVDIHQDKLPDGTYLPTYTITPSLEEFGLGYWVDLQPGTLWIVGNEVERGPNPGDTQSNQGDMFPEIYAQAYHDVYSFIKDRDPTARVANSGMVQVTPGRLQYLDMVWDTYLDLYHEPMPVDVWNMHIYVLPEAELNGDPNGIANIALGTDPELAQRGPAYGQSHLCARDDVYCVAEHDDIGLFEEQVLAMRTWMLNHGQREKPLLLSEFSILYPYILEGGGCFLADEFGNCFGPDRVIDYLNNTFDYLETATVSGLGHPLDGDKLVQQWTWFSINNELGVGFVSNLLEPNEQSGNLDDLTTIGQLFQSRVLEQSAYINLVPGRLDYPVAFTDSLSGTTDVTLWATIGNNGNIDNDIEFEIAFFEDEGLSQVIDSVVVAAPDSGQGGLSGCALEEITVGVNWTGLTPGVHQYWMKVDSSEDVAEGPPGSQIEELDNISTGIVLIDPGQYFIPAFFK